MTTTKPVLRIRCVDPDHASRFSQWLQGARIDVAGVTGIEDRDVLVPVVSALFALDLAETAVEQGYARPDETDAAVREFHAELRSR